MKIGFKFLCRAAIYSGRDIARGKFGGLKRGLNDLRQRLIIF